MVSSEPLYSKFRNFVNLKGPKFKEYTHPRNSREALDNIYFHIEEYIANYFRTYFHLNIYMQNKFHLNIQDILFNQKTCL